MNIERSIEAGKEFSISISVWSHKGKGISLLLRPIDAPPVLGEADDQFIEIEYDRIDEFCEMLQKLKEEQEKT